MTRTGASGVGLLLVAVAFLCANTPTASAGPLAIGVSTGKAPGQASDLDAYTSVAGRPPAVVMYYQQWSEPFAYGRDLAALKARGITPMVTWEPSVSGRGIPLRDIAAGRWDDYIRTSAATAKAYGQPVYVRFGHEMNLKGSPWGPGVNGNTDADYIAAWRRLVTLWRIAGVSNARWAWTPNVDNYGDAPFTQLYPGDAYVDWVGLDGYNWGPLKPSGFQRLGSVFGASHDVLAKLTTKPMLIAETASNEAGGDKAAWIREGMLRDVPTRLPRVRAVIWFDRVKETNWRVNSSPATLAAYREVVAAPLYGGTQAQMEAATPSPVSKPPVGGATDPAPADGAASGESDVYVIGGRFLRSTARLIPIPLLCAAPSLTDTCSPVVEVTARPRGRLVAIKRRVVLQPGAFVRVFLRLPRVMRAELRRGRRFSVVVTVRPTALATPVRRRLALLAPRSHPQQAASRKSRSGAGT